MVKRHVRAKSLDLRSPAIGHSPMAFDAARASGSQARPLTPGFAGMTAKVSCFWKSISHPEVRRPVGRRAWMASRKILAPLDKPGVPLTLERHFFGDFLCASKESYPPQAEALYFKPSKVTG